MGRAGKGFGMSISSRDRSGSHSRIKSDTKYLTMQLGNDLDGENTHTSPFTLE